MKSKFIPVFIFISLFAATAFPPFVAIARVTPDKKLIGYRHAGVKRGERLPNGWRDAGGGLLTDEDYGVTRFHKRGKYALWLERIVGRNRACRDGKCATFYRSASSGKIRVFCFHTARRASRTNGKISI